MPLSHRGPPAGPGVIEEQKAIDRFMRMLDLLIHRRRSQLCFASFSEWHRVTRETKKLEYVVARQREPDAQNPIQGSGSHLPKSRWLAAGPRQRAWQGANEATESMSHEMESPSCIPGGWSKAFRAKLRSNGGRGAGMMDHRSVRMLDLLYDRLQYRLCCASFSDWHRTTQRAKTTRRSNSSSAACVESMSTHLEVESTSRIPGGWSKAFNAKLRSNDGRPRAEMETIAQRAGENIAVFCSKETDADLLDIQTASGGAHSAEPCFIPHEDLQENINPKTLVFGDPLGDQNARNVLPSVVVHTLEQCTQTQGESEGSLQTLEASELHSQTVELLPIYSAEIRHHHGR